VVGGVRPRPRHEQRFKRVGCRGLPRVPRHNRALTFEPFKRRERHPILGALGAWQRQVERGENARADGTQYLWVAPLEPLSNLPGSQMRDFRILAASPFPLRSLSLVATLVASTAHALLLLLHPAGSFAGRVEAIADLLPRPMLLRARIYTTSCPMSSYPNWAITPGLTPTTLSAPR